MSLYSIVFSICRTAIIASPDNVALRQQIKRLHKYMSEHYDSDPARWALMDRIEKLLNQSPKRDEQSLVHSETGVEP